MDSRSGGGKIVAKRYRRHNTTPYDRVPASSQPAPKSPNWLARVVFPATRVIASGASKILSTVFDSDDSSSSSVSSTESGHASENEVDNDDQDNADGVYSLNEDHEEPQLNGEMSYAEQVEQLLMQGEFTRQECDRFIEIIKSRVVDSNLKGEDDEPFETADGNSGDYTDKLRSKAVMVARKWLEQNKVEFSPMPNMDSSINQQIVNEVGSPADVAKQYLKSRSPWTSPSSERFELRTPTTMTSPFREGTSMAAEHESMSSFKKRSSLTSGIWNIQEELRRVRAKATEDMLNSSSPNYARDSVMTNSSISRREYNGKVLNSIYTAPTGNTDLNTASQIAEKPTVLAIPASALLENHRPKTRSEYAASNLSPSFPNISKEIRDSHSIDPKDRKADDAIGNFEGTENTNAVHTTTQVTLAAEVNAGEIHEKLVEENVNIVKLNETLPTEDGNAFLSEASVEVPVMDETLDAVTNVSVMNSDKVGGKVDVIAAKEEEKKKPGRISRRSGRGRVKG